MPDVLTNKTTNAKIIPEIWSAKFHDLNRATLPFLDSVDKSYQADLASFGDTVNITTFPDYAEAEVLAEGAAGSARAVTPTQVKLVINKRLASDILVTDEAQLQSIPFMEKLRDSAIYAINSKLQSEIIATIVPSAAAPAHALSYTTGSTLADADILAAKKLLDLQNTPLEGRVMIVGPNQMNDLYAIEQFKSRDFVANADAVSTGVFDKPIYGFTPKYSTACGDVAYFFHPKFLTVALQQNLRIEVHTQMASGVRAQRVCVDLLCGMVQINDVDVVTIS